MKKAVISVDPFYLKANVERGVCPLDWLVEFYREYSGKLVMLDKNLVDFLLNKAKYDRVEETEHDGYKQTFTIVWEATEEWPETKIVLTSYGKDKIEKDVDYEVDSSTNYYVIEELYADDILVNGQKYAENMKTDRQVILLISRENVAKNEREL